MIKFVSVEYCTPVRRVSGSVGHSKAMPYVEEKKIVVKNLISRKVNAIRKNELKGYKDKYSNGWSLLLIDHSDKIVAKISEPYYKDFQMLGDNLGLTYLGRIPTLWYKIIGLLTDDAKRNSE